ncbi:hypothetical protein EBI_26908 [Enterocytozoon bieneusi H348]|nr:hypothetical protein EBI_26908 [Enterocytozoon bieneusi H348]|eukprot:XP_002651505.1 hypothetical protein EBI_26908 [Enterocytozoon bieneusi H348]
MHTVDQKNFFGLHARSACSRSDADFRSLGRRPHIMQQNTSKRRQACLSCYHHHRTVCVFTPLVITAGNDIFPPLGQFVSPGLDKKCIEHNRSGK